MKISEKLYGINSYLWLKIIGKRHYSCACHNVSLFLNLSSRNKRKLSIQVPEKSSFAQLWLIFDALGPSHWPSATTEWMTSYGIHLLNGNCNLVNSSQRQQKDSLKRDNRIQANIAENANGENTLISVSATLP